MIIINFFKSPLFLFWSIGKIVFKKQNYYENAVSKYSELFSYKFGASNTFSTVNINYMKKFYCCFPIYIDQYNLLSFDHYKLLVDVVDVKKRYFYFNLSIFCNYSVEELNNIISIDLYNYL